MFPALPTPGGSASVGEGSAAARAKWLNCTDKNSPTSACVDERVGPELVWYRTGIPVVYQSRVTPLNTPKTLGRFGFTYSVLRNTH